MLWDWAMIVPRGRPGELSSTMRDMVARGDISPDVARRLNVLSAK